MALRVLMLRKGLSEKQAQLKSLRETAEGFAAREAELEKAIAEAGTDEERTAVEEEVTKFETEQRDNKRAIETAENEIRGIEEQIAQLEQAEKQSREKQTGGVMPARKERNGMINPEKRTRFFGMTRQQRDAFFAHADVTDWLARVRDMGIQKRSVSGAELGVPEVVLELLRDNMEQYSKLIKYVRLKPVKGKARQNIAGTIPEGIWMESVGMTLSELEISFTQIEVDGYRVGGYIPVDNAYLEDDDNLNLGTEIITMLGQAIGLGIDKAIVYGTGSKMPVGFVTRLAASTEPAWWGDKQGDFTNLSTTNVQKLNINTKTGAEFFAALVTALGVADPHYSTAPSPAWIMNRKTHIAINAKALAFNSAAALVAGVNNTMPVVGGEIVDLSFIPDNEIVGGFMDLYMLVERAGANIVSSDIPMFLQEMTVYKGSARYDGKPVRGEGFVAVNFANTAVTPSIDFAAAKPKDPEQSTPGSGDGNS